MFKRLNRWLTWQLKYGEDKKHAPEILARIRKERGEQGELNSPYQAERPVTNRLPKDGVRASLGALLLAEAAKSTVSNPLL